MELLSLNPGMVVWLWVTFILFAFLLRRVAWNPLMNAVQQREQNINDAIARAESARAEAEKVLAEQQEKLASAQEELQQMMKDGKAMAEKARADILADAQADAVKIRDRAKADMEREREAVVASLKKEVADIVVSATEKLIRASVDKSKHQSLIDESIREFGQKN